MSKLYRIPSGTASMGSVAAMNVILGPVITEKSTRLTEAGQYIFQVAKDANKFEIKTAVEKLFNVSVTAVNTINQLGKTKRFRGRMGFRSDTKKAIVTLKSGQSIDLTTGV